MNDRTRPYDLRINHLVAPLGIGADPPRVPWKLPDAAAGQHAYRIVAGDWDSGRVESPDTLFVPVDVTPASARAVEWKVKTWTDIGESDWSDPSRWEHGLLRESDWTAQWVAPAEADDLPARQRPAHQLASAVRIDGAVARARLYATAHGIYEAFVNACRRPRADSGLDRLPHEPARPDLRRHGSAHHRRQHRGRTPQRWLVARPEQRLPAR